MTSKRLSTILDELRVEETEIQRNLERLRVEVKSAESQLAQVRKALASLKGKQNTAVAKKPTATKEEVVRTIESILQAVGSVQQEELKIKVEENLKTQGKSLTGFAMRFKNALNEPQYMQHGNSVSLDSLEVPRSPLEVVP